MGGTGKVIRVPARRLSEVFTEHEVSIVDYLSIDTEGSEWQVLQGVDFAKVHINVIGFEVNYPNSPEHLAIQKLLEGNHFRSIGQIEADAIFIHESPRFSWD